MKRGKNGRRASHHLFKYYGIYKRGVLFCINNTDNGGGGVLNSGKHSDVILERSLRIIILKMYSDAS